MAQKKNRDRNRRIEFYVDENEYNYIRERMKHYGFTNMSLYLRKVAIRSKVEVFDFSAFNIIADEIFSIGKNINQIAVRANSTSRVYDDDISEIKEQVNKIWQLLRDALSSCLRIM